MSPRKKYETERLELRVPPAIKRTVEEMAETQRLSVNQMATLLLEAGCTQLDEMKKERIHGSMSRVWQPSTAIR